MTINEAPLLALLNAKAKNTLDDIFVTCYRFRYDGVPERVRMRRKIAQI